MIILRPFRASAALRFQICRYYTSPPSTTLSRLRNDLKSARRDRDKTRLSVLRAILSDITNSSKANQPVNSDISLLVLLRKRIAASRQAVEQFYEADRKDLVASEEDQLRVLEEYAGSIKTMSDSEIQSVLAELVTKMRKEKGEDSLTTPEVMKRSVGSGGPFEGRIVSKGDIARIVKQVLQ